MHDTTTAVKVIHAGRSFGVTLLSVHEGDVFEWAADGRYALPCLVRRASERAAR